MKPQPHMTPDELRRYGKELVDWIADYHERIESFPVLSRVEPGDDSKASLPLVLRKRARASTR